jgi:hypothetical protein
LGIGNTTNYFYPVPVIGGALANKIVVDAVTGYFISLALTQDNKLAAWGINSNGMYKIVCNNSFIGASGIGSTSTPKASPVFVDMTGALSGKIIASMISTYSGFMVLDTNGFVYSWGDNSFGKNRFYIYSCKVK